MGNNIGSSGKVIFGKVATSEDTHEVSATGAFVRQDNYFITPFGDGEGELPVEAGRYRLIWTSLCPWATRQIIALKLLGLEDVISVGKVSPVRTENGWEFSLDPKGVDPVLGIRYLPEIYARRRKKQAQTKQNSRKVRKEYPSEYRQERRSLRPFRLREGQRIQERT